MNPQETARCVEAVLRGDKNAFADLVEQHQHMAIGLAYQSTRTQADAEEIAQEAFLRAYSTLGRLKSPEKFGSWLYGIVLNVARERSRKHLTLIPLEPDSQVPQAKQEDLALETAVLAEVSQLPDKYRIPLTMKYLREMSYTEIAEALAIPQATVRSLVHRAREMLRNMHFEK